MIIRSPTSKRLDLGGMSTSTPIAANGRVYVGVCGSGQFSQYSGHHIAVIDAESFKVVYTLETDGYCQSSALVKTMTARTTFTLHLTTPRQGIRFPR